LLAVEVEYLLEFANGRGTLHVGMAENLQAAGVEGEEREVHKFFPHNKTTQKQKVDGTYSAELQAQTELPGLGQAAAPHTSGGWLDTTRCRTHSQRRRGRRLDAIYYDGS
jgi:hypothetical protein